MDQLKDHMSQRKKYLVDALSICFVLYATSAPAQQAVVNGVVIPNEKFDLFAAELIKQGQADSVQLRSLVRNELIDREILVQEALRRGLDRQPLTTFALENAYQQVMINSLVQDLLRGSKPGISESEKREFLLRQQQRIKSSSQIVRQGPFWDGKPEQKSALASSDQSISPAQLERSPSPQPAPERPTRLGNNRSAGGFGEPQFSSSNTPVSATQTFDVINDLDNLIKTTPKGKPNPDIHILIIGINDYADVPDVPFADRSATSFAEFSKKNLRRSRTQYSKFNKR